MPAVRNGSRTGGMPAAASSLCWGAGMRSAGASSALPVLLQDGTLVLRLRMPDCLAGQHGKHLVIEA